MKMPPKKPSAHLPLTSREGFQGNRSVVNGGGRIQRKSIEPNHWDFLEEIDAPMWVDLSLESMTMNEDRDDSWFHVAHPFHQCSYRELISTLSVSDEGKANSSSELLGSSSPKLPTSVSGSRGNNYKCRKWRGDNHVVSVNKQHPIKILGRKTLRVVSLSGSGQEVKPKKSIGNSKRSSSLKIGLVREARLRKPNSLQNKHSSESAKCSSSLKKILVGESSSADTKKPDVTRTNTSFGDSESTSSLNAGFPCGSHSSTASSNVPNSPKPKFSFGDWRSSSNSATNTVGQNNQPETITDQIFGRKSGLLSAVRVSIRKSVVSRQASRVEVKDGVHKSSSSKSSAGSFSTSRCNLNNTVLTGKLNIKRTIPESKKVVRMAQPTKENNFKGTNVSKKCKGRFLDHNSNSNSRREGDAIAVKSIRQETSNSKVLYQSEPRKSLRLRNLKAPSTAGLKAKKSMAGNSKVNPLGHLASKQKVGGKENTLGSMRQTQKASKDGSEIKDGQELLDPNPKVKANGRSKGKNPKIYFR